MSGFLLLALALWPVAPAVGGGASSAAGEITLDLVETLGADWAGTPESAPAGLLVSRSLAVDAADAASAPEIRIAEVRNGWRTSPDVAPQTSTPDMAPEKKGAGRWLKKHWYVPVLAAVAVGAALSSSSDDDRGGEDD